MFLILPVCKACISFSELTSCHSFSISDFTSSPSAAAPPQRSIHTQVWWTEAQKRFGKSHICGLCARYRQPDGVKLPSWCGMDVQSWAEAKRSRGGGKWGGPGAPWVWILHDGTQGWKELNTHEVDEYIVVPCVPLWLPSMHWLQRFVIAQPSGRGERGERVEW